MKKKRNKFNEPLKVSPTDLNLTKTKYTLIKNKKNTIIAKCIGSVTKILVVSVSLCIVHPQCWNSFGSVMVMFLQC